MTIDEIRLHFPGYAALEARVEAEEPGTQAWYLAEALPRLKRLDKLSDIAYPNGDQMPKDDAGYRRMLTARNEWDELMRLQTQAEVAAGL